MTSNCWGSKGHGLNHVVTVMVFHILFWNFHPDNLGKMISNLTSIFFERGWFNHQLDEIFRFFFHTWNFSKQSQTFGCWMVLVSE